MTEDHLEKGIEEALNQKMEELGREVGKPIQMRRNEPSTQVLDFDKLMSIGERLLKQKMDEHMKEVSVYELQRIELIDSYRVRMERLKIEAEEQLRSLEQLHNTKLEALEKLINKLRTLREA